MAAGSSSAGSRAAARPSAPPATRTARCATAHATKSCSSSPRTSSRSTARTSPRSSGSRSSTSPRPPTPGGSHKHLRAGGEGWYITHYEVLSLLGVKNEALPVQNVPVHEAEGERTVLDSTEFCPACHASRARRLAAGQPAGLRRGPHRGGQRRNPQPHLRIRPQAPARQERRAPSRPRVPRRRDLHRRGHAHQGRRFAAQQGDPRATGPQQAARDRHADLQLRQPNLLADVVVPGRLEPALPLQLRRRPRRVRGRLLRPRVHLRQEDSQTAHRREKRKVLPQGHERQPVLASGGRRDDPPPQARTSGSRSSPARSRRSACRWVSPSASSTSTG